MAHAVFDISMKNKFILSQRGVDTIIILIIKVKLMQIVIAAARH
jgi:hypothetical protein